MNITSYTPPFAATTGAGPSPALRQQFQDMKSLGKALQSGDLTAARSAFDQLSKDIQNAPAPGGKSSPLQDPNSAAGKDFKALQEALKSGDTQAAQDAFNTLRKDLRAAGGGHVHGGHHAHAAGGDGDGDADDNGPKAPGTQAGSPFTGSGPLQSLNATA
jgi:ribosomal protein S20